jgi:diaminopimelate decarboxylase
MNEGDAATYDNDVIGLAADLWPHTARFEPDGEISVGGLRLSAVAARYGTPSFILDEADVRHRCRAYASALPDAETAYAGEAFLCRAMAQWIDEEGLSLDVCSAGEIAVARAVAFPAGRMILHGNAKAPADLDAAFGYGVGRIVIDGTTEIARLAALAPRRQRVLVRVTPGVDAHAHWAVAAGTEDQKFGLLLNSCAAADAVGRVLTRPELDLVGLHCHLGSQLTELSAYEIATRRLLGLMATVRERHGVVLAEVSLGGGHATPNETGEECDLGSFAGRIRRVIADECVSLRLPVPHLVIEPGRAIVNQAMVTLYRVLGVKHGAAGRALVAVDGGMSDNRWPELYGASYSVHPVRASRARPVLTTVVGRHCQAGDVLAADVPLPADLRPGDLVAVAGTGAFNHAVASNYDMVGRPPVIAVRDGTARPLIRRETSEDLLARDIGL